MRKIGNHVAKFLTKNSNYILSIASIAGVVLTTVLAVKATPKAMELIEEKKEEEKTEELAPIETAKTVWKCYIPAGVAGISTIFCIALNATTNENCKDSLIGAYAVVNRYFDDYRNKVKEIYGEDAHQNIVNSVMKDRYYQKLEKCDPPYISAPELMGTSSIEFRDSNEEIRMFYDIYSDRYFETTISKVLEAEYHLNRNYILGCCACVNDFYEFLGISKIENGDNLIWSCFDGLQWIDFNHEKVIFDDGMECYTIEMVFEPVSDVIIFDHA